MEAQDKKKQKKLLYVFHQSVCNILKHFVGSTLCNWEKKKKRIMVD